MDTWPVALQQKLDVDAFQYAPGDTLVSTDMDVGPAKKRSRFTDAVDNYDCQILLDHDEVAIFKTFYKVTLSNGALPFLFNEPFTQVQSTFRFKQIPSIRPLGGRTFTLSMSWERLP